MSRNSTVIAGALLWIAGLEWFAAQAIAQSAWRTPYSLSSNFISDLGAVHCGTEIGLGYVCSPLHTLMNASFLVIGVCTVAGVLLLRKKWPRSKSITWGLWLLGLFGAGKVTVGLAPEDQRLLFHAVGSLGILFGNIGCLILAVSLRRTSRTVALVFLCIGVVGVIAFVLQLDSALTTIRGALERLADWPLPLWLAMLGGTFLAGGEPVGVGLQRGSD